MASCFRSASGLLFGTLALLAGVACREATPPQPKRYILRTVDGQGLPAVVFQDNGVTKYITAGEAVLGAGDRFLLVVRDSSDSSILPEAAKTDSVRGSHRTSGSHLLVDFAPPESFDAYSDTGTVTARGDTLRVRTHFPIGRDYGVAVRQFLYTRQ